MQVGMPFGLALLVSFAVPALAGVVVEKLGVARLMSGPYLYQLLFLFGTALVLEQLIIIIWGTVGLSAQPPEWLQGAFDLQFTWLPKYLVFNGVMAALTIAVVWQIGRAHV